MHAVAALLLLLPQEAAPPASAPLVFRGAKVYTMDGPPLEGASVVVENGRIAAVGRELPTPPGARIVDVSGKVLLPGLIDAACHALLDPPGQLPGSAEQDVLDGLDRFGDDVREARAHGVTTVFLRPPGSGPAAGLGAVVRLDGSLSVVRPRAALRLSLAAGTQASSPVQRYEAYRRLSRLLEEAREHGEALEKHEKDRAAYEEKKKTAKPEAAPKPPARPARDPARDVLARLFDAKAPLAVRVEAHAADAIGHALRLLQEHKLAGLLEGGTEAAERAADLAQAKASVVLGPVFAYGTPSVDFLRHSPGAAAALAKAGVPFAIGTFRDGRFLLDAAATAVGAGLPAETALAAITREPARLLGLEDAGTLAKGKRADLVVLSGEPFDAGTDVEETWIGGERVFAGSGRE